MDARASFSEQGESRRVLFKRLSGRVQRWSSALQPSSATNRWIFYVVLIGVLAIGAWIGATTIHLRMGSIIDASVGGVAALALFFAVLLLIKLINALGRILLRHWTISGIAVAVVLTLMALNFDIAPPMALIAGTGLGLALTLAGVACALLVNRPIAALIAGVPAILFIIFGSWWLFSGSEVDDPTQFLVRGVKGDGGAYAGFLERGPFSVGQLTYGSGIDKRRQEYADGVAWKSESVDVTPLLGRPSGFAVDLRERWWGFGLDAAPLNGRVWFPEGETGLLPVVLIVHGNHDMMRWSDTGYDWLADHLASRGYLAVSVDQNFLNGSLIGSLERENAARGWLILEHLAAWRRWSHQPSHPLHERVDLDRVVLIGHSRGGEAVVLAAAFNKLAAFPEDGNKLFDYQFGIRGIAGIAPVSGQFLPSDKLLRLEGPSYFVMHGGHDADVSYMAGDRQYTRINPDPRGGTFRASLYIHHGNHGQFNTSWEEDARGPRRSLLNRAALLSGSEQRQVALLYLTAFVEATVASTVQMPKLFCDASLAGTLIPDTVYVSRCDGGGHTVLADFEDDIDLRTGSIAGGVRLEGERLALWRERDIGLRGSRQRHQSGVWLGWRSGSGPDPFFSLAWPAGLLPHLDNAVLWLDMAQVDRDPPTSNDSEASPTAEAVQDAADIVGSSGESHLTGGLRAPLLINIELEDAHGVRVQRSLSEFAELLPPLPVRHTRLSILDSLDYGQSTEPLISSVAVPLHAFAGAGLDLSSVQRVRLLFDRSREGMLVISRIALETESSRRSELTDSDASD